MPKQLLRLIFISVVFVFISLFLFPQGVLATTVSDNFNRSNGGLGDNWTTIAGTTAPVIISNQIEVAAADDAKLHSAYWDANQFNGNQFAQATFPNSPNVTHYGPGIAVRLADSRGYILWWGNVDDSVTIWRMDNSTSWTQIAISNSLTITNTDTWKLIANGSSLKGYQNGNLVVQATDTNYTDGSPGVWLYYSVNQLDNWSGGDVYTIGGTISGLSGTVVLQNNSGDNLNVSSNGSFTFGMALSDGSAYSVAVKTNPVGQTCTASSSSGTVASANVTNVSVTCVDNLATNAEDNFNRDDGSLGPNWLDFDEGGFLISSQVISGTGASNGDIRVSENYPSNQYSEIETTSTQLTGNQWIGPIVRAQNGGDDLYTGIYFWNSGSPVLRIYKRVSTAWTQLGSDYSCGALSAGTKLKLVVVGSTISFLQDDVERIAVYDGDLTGGAPGVMSSGASTKIDNWSGGDASFEVHYLSTDGNGVKSYNMISNYNGYGPHILRILEPDNPTAGVAHNFIYALPVEAELGTTYGDGLETLRGLNAHNQYNLTIIAPSFDVNPWYADHPTDTNYSYESFMTSELQPWVEANLATSGYEEHWIIGFSKSGLGAIDLIFRHQDLFTLAAAWDFPAGMSSYDQYGASGIYGTDENFQSNYRLTGDFLDTYKIPFLTTNRIWINGYQTFETDISNFDSLLTTKGIAHTTATPQLRDHLWGSGWVPLALAALSLNSTNLPDTIAPTVTAFTIPATSDSFTVTVSAFTATDDTEVTGYKLTESSSPPSAGDVGWSATAPTSYTFSTSGSKTLWAWAKDAAGNVSTGSSDSVNVTATTVNSSPTSTTVSNPDAPVCSDQAPGIKAPWLYTAIAQDSDSILLYFTEADNPVDKYVLTYGTKSGEYFYGLPNIGGKGLQFYLVQSLSPNTTYYFKIRGGNGCATGPWSNEISATTKGFVSFNQLKITESQLEIQQYEETKEKVCQTYTVNSSDSLWLIARKLLGDGTRFDEIIEQNKDKYPSLETSDEIKVGWLLKINCGDEIEEITTDDSTVTSLNGYNLKIRVVDNNNQPVIGAKVILHSTPTEASTDESGYAAFRDIESGDHKIIVSYNGYQGEQAVNLTGDVKEFTFNIKVQPQPFSLSLLAYGIIGFMGFVILLLTLLLIRSRKSKDK